MSDDDDLRINTLHRFAKHSPRLILHEYSHCEVPAGCGGVVLRWMDPALGVPAKVELDVERGEGTVWLDGVELASSMTELRAGARVIALHITCGRAPPQPFYLEVTYDADSNRDLVATGAPRWRCTTAPPPAGWTDPVFDDTHWSPVPLATDALIGTLEPWRQRVYGRRAVIGGVFAIESEELWLRVHFTASEPP